jgi:hypothetical protein
MKFLLLLMCLISFQHASSQGQPKDKCEILKEVLEGDSIVARKLYAERTHALCSVELKRIKDKFYLKRKKCGVID